MLRARLDPLGDRPCQTRTIQRRSCATPRRRATGGAGMLAGEDRLLRPPLRAPKEVGDCAVDNRAAG